ncbi:hypothetical protein C1Y63_02545 [Corynebacterium sp. 13CS0277]|uniref:AAA family ATPase n=1 Tax=Corynebacterium sp. 13CS0277 TaxID=2071994 RepID=UPI000D03DFB9|nr:AAA family ATPase [Corynebacterium sp. 13CS0277]PRQ12209.1 hypothetical protein C1Y63_02545 [Corynebacterium sp. 13CS0277]
MLLSLALENYQSFRDEVFFTMQRKGFNTNMPAGDKGWSDCVHPVAGLFGPNASGKSTLLTALAELSAIARHTVEPDCSARSLHRYYRGDVECAEAPTVCDLEFVADGHRYRWYLEIDAEGVREEQLDVVTTSRWRRVFHRTATQVTWGSLAEVGAAAQQAVARVLDPDVLLLGAVRILGDDAGVAAPAARWICSQVTLLQSTSGFDKYEQKLAELIVDERWREVVNVILRHADVGISEVRLEERELTSTLLARIDKQRREIEEPLEKHGVTPWAGARTWPSFDEEDGKQILRSIRLVHHAGGGNFELPLEEESEGTRAVLILMIHVALAFERGMTLLIDDISSTLHRELVEQILTLFRDDRFAEYGAQVIVASHDSTLMDGFHDVDAVDAVWLLSKRSGASRLRSLGEFSVRKQHRVSTRYAEGVYGSVPFAELEFGAVVDLALGNVQFPQPDGASRDPLAPSGHGEDAPDQSPVAGRRDAVKT